MKYKILQYINAGDHRTVNAKKNIFLSLVNKFLAILISLALVPLTLDYLNAEQYGLWLSISSIVTWLSFFDVGLGHGFRYRFAEAKANSDLYLAKSYVSTTYAILILIFSVVLVLLECVNPLINWASIFNISQQYQNMLSKVASIIIVGVCVQFVVNVVSLMLLADQKPAFAAMINTLGQGIALLAIFFLTILPKHSMTYIAVALIWIPIIVTFFVSIFLFRGKYQSVSPALGCIDFSLTNKILSLGVKFFLIQISQIFIIHFVNIIITREMGPEYVAEYNIEYKYFSLSMLVLNIVLSPYWSAFTDAYVKKDIPWMINVKKKLTQVTFIFVCFNILLLLLSPLVIGFWISDSVKISFTNCMCMTLYISLFSFSNLYMILLNGIGKVFLQMVIYIGFSLISIPCSIYLCRYMGIPGILLNLSVFYVIQAIVAKIQLEKILSDKAFGFWTK